MEESSATASTSSCHATETDDAIAHSAKRRRTVDEKRRFVPSWKLEYPWVYFEDNKLLCRYCVDSRKHNAFTTGSAQLKKDALKKHVLPSDHRAAMAAKAGRRDMQLALATTHRSYEKAVTAALHLVYFMAKKNLPSDSFSDLKQLLVLQVCALSGKPAKVGMGSYLCKLTVFLPTIHREDHACLN